MGLPHAGSPDVGTLAPIASDGTHGSVTPVALLDTAASAALAPTGFRPRPPMLENAAYKPPEPLLSLHAQSLIHIVKMCSASQFNSAVHKRRITGTWPNKVALLKAGKDLRRPRRAQQRNGRCHP